MSELRKAAQAVIQAWDDPAGTTGVCRALDDLRAALAEPTGKEGLQVDLVAWADKAMELATNFAVNSLRVGSHERKDSLLNNGVYTFETTMLRDKREKDRDRLRQHLYAAPPQLQPLHDMNVLDLADLYRKQMTIEEAVAAERDECAKIVERNAAVCIHSLTLWDVLNANALAIRARSNTNEQ